MEQRAFRADLVREFLERLQQSAPAVRGGPASAERSLESLVDFPVVLFWVRALVCLEIDKILRCIQTHLRLVEEFLE
jgi:hypothetical protein